MELITDRTQADVTRAQELNKKVHTAWDSMDASELAEWKAGLKGAYNYTDLNRVGEAVQELSALLIALPSELEAYRKSKEVYYRAEFVPSYDPAKISVTAKTDWGMTTQISKADADAYLADIGVIRSQLPNGCPQVPASFSALNYIKANNIEQILLTVYNNAAELKQGIISKIDQAAADGTVWKKYTTKRTDKTQFSATLSGWETTYNGATDQTSITGYTGYTYTWVDTADGKRECQFAPTGSQKTIYATGNSSKTVYTFPDPYTVVGNALFLINDTPKLHTQEQTVKTTETIVTSYYPDQYEGEVTTQGYAYPDGVTSPSRVYKDKNDEVYEVITEYYYYTRIK